MSGRLLFPELGPVDVADGWLPEPPALTSRQVLDALARRHPMDGYNGVPGRWVFTREVQAATGSYSDVQRFDAVAIGLVPSVKYARVVYEVKVSRADWLRELRPTAKVTYRGPLAAFPIGGRRAASIAANREALADSYEVIDARKWDAALAVSTEYWVAAPPHCVQVDELPPEAGFVEIRLWGQDREPRARIVRRAPVRDTPNPGPEFWASVLRRASERRPA